MFLRFMSVVIGLVVRRRLLQDGRHLYVSPHPVARPYLSFGIFIRLQIKQL